MVNVDVPTNFLIMISIVIFVLIVLCILYIIYKDRKKDDEEINEIIEDLVKAKPREKISKIEQKEEKLESLINAKIEVPIGQIKEEQPKEKMNLEDMLEQMQKSLDSKQEIVDNFESEQEEKAIISYKQLLENMNNEEFRKELDDYELEQEKTASDVTKEKVLEFLKKEEPKIARIESPTEKKSKKFKTTDFISPIFGKQEANIEYPTIKSFKARHAKDNLDIIDEMSKPTLEKVVPDTLEQVINIEPLTDEIKKNTEFLNALKEFRSNL